MFIRSRVWGEAIFERFLDTYFLEAQILKWLHICGFRWYVDSRLRGACDTEKRIDCGLMGSLHHNEFPKLLYYEKRRREYRPSRVATLEYVCRLFEQYLSQKGQSVIGAPDSFIQVVARASTMASHQPSEQWQLVLAGYHERRKLTRLHFLPDRK